jgi:UPF0716 family protein affecting phage T7 exclusion
MRSDRMLDLFILSVIAVTVVMIAYFAWVVSIIGPHWAHLAVIALGLWGWYAVHHVEALLSSARSAEFRELVEDWVRRGSPDEPIDTGR